MSTEAIGIYSTYRQLALLVQPTRWCLMTAVTSDSLSASDCFLAWVHWNCRRQCQSRSCWLRMILSNRSHSSKTLQECSWFGIWMNLESYSNERLRESNSGICSARANVFQRKCILVGSNVWWLSLSSWLGRCVFVSKPIRFCQWNFVCFVCGVINGQQTTVTTIC